MKTIILAAGAMVAMSFGHAAFAQIGNNPRNPTSYPLDRRAPANSDKYHLTQPTQRPANSGLLDTNPATQRPGSNGALNPMPQNSGMNTALMNSGNGSNSMNSGSAANNGFSTNGFGFTSASSPYGSSSTFIPNNGTLGALLGTTGSMLNGNGMTGSSGLDSAAQSALSSGGYGSGSYGSDGGYSSDSYGQGTSSVMGDRARGYGEYNLYTSKALLNYEDAYSKMLDNNKKYAETFWAKRRLYSENTSINRSSPEELSRYAQEAAPKRMTSYQLNPVSGTINWPATLRDDDFAVQREGLNRLFAERGVDAGLGSENYRAITALTTQMMDELKSRVGDVSSSEYVSAKRFLTSLAYEAQFVPGAATDGVAAN